MKKLIIFIIVFLLYHNILFNIFNSNKFIFNNLHLSKYEKNIIKHGEIIEKLEKAKSVNETIILPKRSKQSWLHYWLYPKKVKYEK